MRPRLAVSGTAVDSLWQPAVHELLCLHPCLFSRQSSRLIANFSLPILFEPSSEGGQHFGRHAPEVVLGLPPPITACGRIVNRRRPSLRDAVAEIRCVMHLQTTLVPQISTAQWASNYLPWLLTAGGLQKAEHVRRCTYIFKKFVKVKNFTRAER